MDNSYAWVEANDWNSDKIRDVKYIPGSGLFPDSYLPGSGDTVYPTPIFKLGLYFYLNYTLGKLPDCLLHADKDEQTF